MDWWSGGVLKCCFILKGWKSLSPGLRGTSYPGKSRRSISTLKELHLPFDRSSMFVMKPLQGLQGFGTVLPRVARSSLPWEITPEHLNSERVASPLCDGLMDWWI